MTSTNGPDLPRRRLLQASLLAGAALSLAPTGAQGRTTDTVRLTWGYGGLTLVAKERGVLARSWPRASRSSGSVRFPIMPPRYRQ